MKMTSALLLTPPSCQIRKDEGDTGPMIASMMTNFFRAHLVKFVFSLNTPSVGVFTSSQGDIRLSGWVSVLPGETSVDFVPCLKASAACGFLTCQSAILRGLSDSYWLGDGPPWIYAEHTPNKKCKERDGNRKMTERLTSACHILANITRYRLPENARKSWVQSGFLNNDLEEF